MSLTAAEPVCIKRLVHGCSSRSSCCCLPPLPLLLLHLLYLLLSVAQTAGISFPANEPVTLFAPINKAFDAFDEDKQPRNLQKYTGMTLEQLFLTANRHKLVQVCVSPPCTAVHAP